jgi:hypothetical protein
MVYNALAWVFIIACIHYFRTGFNNHEAHGGLFHGDLFPIGSIIEKSCVAEKATPNQPPQKKSKEEEFSASPLVSDCAEALKSFDMKVPSLKEIHRFVEERSVSSVEEFIIAVTKR